MMIGALTAAGTAGSMAYHALSGMASAVKQANDMADELIDELKASENITVNRIGRVLEGTKFGFLMGYVSPSIVTAVGVCLTTGNLAMAIGGSVAVLGNPIAGTCAAVGAVYFGWQALTESEREGVLKQVGDFLHVGWEQIKAVISFAIGKMKELLNSDNIKEIKETVSEVAASVGRHISDITKSLSDKAAKAAEAVGRGASAAVDTAGDVASNVADAASTAATSVSETASKASFRLGDYWNKKSDSKKDE